MKLPWVIAGNSARTRYSGLKDLTPAFAGVTICAICVVMVWIGENDNVYLM